MIQKQINLKIKMFNLLMVDGKKQTREKEIFKTFKNLQKTNEKNHNEILKQAIVNLTPTTQIRQIRKKKRKSIKEFPYILNKRNRLSLGLKFMLQTSTRSSDRALSSELILLAGKKSEKIRVKESNHVLALNEKKYSFFRWFY